MVLNAYVGNETLTDQQKTAADVDLSGEIDPTDAMLILQKYVDLVPELPVVDE